MVWTGLLAAAIATGAAAAPDLRDPLGGAGVRTSGFGARVDPFTQRQAFHSGQDFAAAMGTPVYAAQAGRVVHAGPQGAYGLMIEVDHGDGRRTRYAQLSSVAVAPGQTVDVAAQIGSVGSSGRSTGPHLHFELWIGDAVHDPVPHLLPAVPPVAP
jgi:murein DD-endopeptidase MepM/ murein hydrolase activator NlpD